MRASNWPRPVKPFVTIVFAVAISILLASIVFGQGTAYLTGYVIDPSSAAVPNASVQIKSNVNGTTFNLTTTSAGVYRSPALQPGTYTVTVSAAGFQTAVLNSVVVETGQPTGIDVHLNVGQTQQEVNVSAGATLLKTEDSGLGQSIDYSQVARLPYFGRSAGALLSLSPGVRYGGEDSISYGASRYNIGGWTNVNVIVDGSPVNGDREDVAQMTYNPSVESLEEVKVVTNQYSAEYGQDVGSLVLMETKSGANKFHGGAYEYLRNEWLDSTNHFSNTKPRDRQNMFGGTFGGPIKKDKLFFFTSQEGIRQTTPAGLLLTVPTAAMKQGNFAGLPPIYDPASTTCSGGVCTRTAFPNNQIPVTSFDPVAANVLQYLPDPNLPGFVNNLSTNSGYSTSRYRGTVKIDWNISPRDTFAAVWMLDRVTDNNLGVSAYNAINKAASPTIGAFGFQYQSQVYNFSETHLFSPTTFISNRVIWRPRFISRLNPGVDPSAKYAENLGIKNYAGALMDPSLGGDLGFPTFNFTGYSGVGPGYLLFQEAPIHEFDYQGSVSLVRGSHTMKFGVDVEKGEHGAPDQSYPTGLFNFGSLETSQPGLANTGNSFASFLLGQVDSASTVLGPRLTWKNTYLAPYFQDDWKVNRKLTVNLGLRWDIDFPITEIQHRGNGFDPNAINPISNTPGIYTFQGINGTPTNFFNTDWRRIAPRIGFAYEVLDKTVIRGGFGIYNTNPTLGANARAPSDGFTTNASFSSPDSGVTPSFVLSAGFPTYPVGGDPNILNSSFGAVPVGQQPTSSPTYVDRNWKLGYAENFNLSVQRELSSTMMLEVAGQGSLGRKLAIYQNVNEVVPQLWGLPGLNVVRRPFPQFNNVTDVRYAEGNTNYYGGYARFNKRFSRGLTLIANYNIGKSIGFVGGDYYFPQYSRTLAIYNSANGATGMPIHQASIAWAYPLPFGPGREFLSQGLIGNLLGGWDLGGMFTVHSGVPFDITSGTDSLNANSPLGNRVDLVGSAIPANQNPSNYLSASSFAAPAFGTIGNFCCSKLYSPNNAMVNVSLQKAFSVREGYNLRLVSEIFNLFNSPQWGVPDTNLTDPSFGTITGPGSGQGSGAVNPQDGARIIQLGIRLDF